MACLEQSPQLPAYPLPAYLRPAYRWYVLALLTLVYTFNFIDRQLVVILQEQIRADLSLMDWQLGLLSGFVFLMDNSRSIRGRSRKTVR